MVESVNTLSEVTHCISLFSDLSVFVFFHIRLNITLFEKLDT